MINSKIVYLRELMAKHNIDYYIVSTADPHGSEYIDPHYKSREYMTGFTGSAGTLIVSKNEASLFVDGRYHIQASEQIANTGITLYKVGEPLVPTSFQFLVNTVKAGETIGFDGNCYDSMTYELLKDKLKDVNFEIEDDLIDYIWKDRPELTKNKVFILPKDCFSNSLKDKVGAIRKYMSDNEFDSVLISELSDIMWILNIRGNDINCNPVAYSYLYVTKDACILYINLASCEDEVLKYFNDNDVIVADYTEIKIELAKIKGKKIALDNVSTNCLNKKILSCGNDVISVNNHEFIAKHIKDENEIACARKYHETDAVSMIKFIRWVKEAVKTEELTEYDVAKKIDEFRKQNEGFFDLSFETIAAYKENAAIVHYSPKKVGSKMLKPEGLLLLDSGAQYIGATTDITRTISLGDVPEEEKRAYTLVLKGNLRLMNAIFMEGCKGQNLDILARETLWQNGLDYMHGTGHGIGSFLNVHEGPIAFRIKINENNVQPDIKPGLIISDEPGLYIEGKYGIRHETQLLCIEKFKNEYGKFLGFEPLSLVPFEKDMIIVELLTKDEIDILNKYHEMCFERLKDRLNEDEYIWFKDICSPIGQI